MAHVHRERPQHNEGVELEDLAVAKPPPQDRSEARRQLYASLPLSANSKEIRILDLDADSVTHAESTVTGRLRVVNLDKQPVFSALSYVWKSAPASIICNGVEVDITSNCLSALHRIVKRQERTSVWIDAICINQNDDEEKHHQIGLMADIYSRAPRVMVWLGEGNDNTDLAMEFLARGACTFSGLGSHSTARMSSATKAVKIESSLRFTLHLLERRVLSLLPNSSVGPVSDGLRDIFTRPWIHRLWTLQEAVLAKNIQIMCGDGCIRWTTMMYSLDALDFPRSDRFFETSRDMHAWRNVVEIWKRHHFGTGIWANGLRAELGLIWYELVSLLLEFGWYYVLVLISQLWRDHLSKRPDDAALYVPVCFLAVLFFVLLVQLRRRLGIHHQEASGDFDLFVSRAHKSADISLFMALRQRQVWLAKDRYYGIRSLLTLDQAHHMSYYTTTTTEDAMHSLFRDVLEYSRTLNLLLLTPSATAAGGISWVITWETAPTWWMRPLQDCHPLEQPRNRPYRLVSSVRKYLETTSTGLGRLVSLLEDGHSQLVFQGATPESESHWDFLSRDELRVDGHIVGKVTWSPGPLQTDEDLSEAEAHSFEVFRAATNRVHRSDMKILFDYLGFIITSGWKETSTTLFKILWNQRDYLGDVCGWLQQRWWNGSWLHDLGEACRFFGRMLEYLHREKLTLVQCEIGTMTNIGYTSEIVEAGDDVVLIAGVTLPMILRRHKDRPGRFVVIGAAFVPALLTGEQWQGLGVAEDIILV